MDSPTLYLDSWAWVNARKRDGTWPLDRSGRVYTIMARPRYFERGDGTVWDLVPTRRLLLDYQAQHVTMLQYRARFEAAVRDAHRSGALFAGALTAVKSTSETSREYLEVRDGDTLCCACGKAASLAGECHRAWAAPWLVRAGWRVVLDGAEVAP